MANLFILQAVGFIVQTSHAVFTILLTILGGALKVSAGTVALFWYALEACFGFDRSITDFGYAFTCGILSLLGLAVFCGKFDLARWFYDVFDPILVCMDWAVMQGVALFRGESEVIAAPYDGGGFQSGDAANSAGPASVYFPFHQPGTHLYPNGSAPILHEFHQPQGYRKPPGRAPVGFNVYRTDTDESLQVRYRSSSIAAGRLLSDHRQSSRLLAGPSALLAGVDPSAMPSTGDMITPSTSMLQNRNEREQGEKDGVESEEALNGLEREIRLATHHSASSPLHGNDDFTPSAPPLITHSSAESVWLRTRKQVADYTYLPSPRFRPLYSLHSIGEINRSMIAKGSGQNGTEAEQHSGIAIKAVSTRDVCTNVSKSLTALESNLRLAGVKDSMEERSKSLACIVCQDKSTCMVTMPCRHMTSCETCLEIILDKDRKCPLCRKSIQEFMKVYT